jgi:glycosyltransferase involved in cell wall biosynthesis|tara:strand:- start:395 stop:1345 length:951 start_codon:yes stop_codon:yes gene_type:complete
MIIVGPQLNSGIGQHAFKYTKVFENASYHVIGSELPESEHGLMFLLPVKSHVDYIKYAKTRVKNMALMTVCETETVHEDYGLIMEQSKNIMVPSVFCKQVLSRQFPGNDFYIIHAHIPPPDRPYTFYHIGNIMDDRKNFRGILEAFMRLNKPNVKLVVKATCNQDVQINLPNVEVINGLISDEEMDKLHDRCDCYVSFSKSEGVGMGPVEAALRDKPVIITNFGGSPEYVKTPYTIECELQELERDDFLFKKGMIWGKPNPNQLLEFMQDAYDKQIRYMNHEHTKKLVGKENILQEFLLNVIGTEYNDTNEDGTTH